jgi:hypothetical protein
MHKDKLIKLAEFLWDLEPEKFNFSEVVSDWDEKNHCGTVCCAIGYTPQLFPEEVEWLETCESGVYDVARKSSSYPEGYIDVASKLFGISTFHADILFTPYSPGELSHYGTEDFPHKSVTLLGDSATPKEVSQMIRSYINAIEHKEATK